MATTRKIKEAKDISSGELIYFKGHAKATYMSDGSTVEDAINNIEVGNEVYATKEELSSKQDIITDLEVIRQGAAKGATALQSYTEQYKGTVTGVKINGSTKNPSSGVVDLGTVITSHQDISGKQDKLVSGTNIKTINGTSILGEGNIDIEDGTQVQSDWSETDAYNPAYIKNKPNITRKYLTIQGYGGGFLTPLDVDEPLDGISLNGLEGVLISTDGLTFLPEFGDTPVWKIHNNGDGTKFLADDGTYKTISSGGSSSGNGAYAEINHGTSDTTFTLTPNTFHVWDEVSTLTLTLGSETSGVANEYLFQFTSGSEPTTLILPDSIKFNSDFTVEENKIYQISILNGLGTVISWDI
jgi:hypothetical protein